MNIEQKAKAYDEALERARAINNGETTGALGETVCEFIFPELKESEDEKIRKKLISFVENWDKGGIVSKYTSNTNDIKRILAWLEKQGKKKSIDCTHTNVFTEKVAIWFNNNFIVHDEYGVISDSFDTKEEMFEDFKNYMKEE